MVGVASGARGKGMRRRVRRGEGRAAGAVRKQAVKRAVRGTRVRKCVRGRYRYALCSTLPAGVPFVVFSASFWHYVVPNQKAVLEGAVMRVRLLNV